MKTPIRILQISGDIRRDSGVMNVISNWHRYMDITQIQFDYLTFFPSNKNDYEQEILRLGGRVYQLPHPYKHPLNFLKESYQFFKKYHYHTIHSHITHLNFFFYPLAKLFGTKNIIQHSHLTKWSDKKLNGLRNWLMLHAVWPLITHKMACSQAAGKVYFGKNFLVVNNGIDVDKFAFNSDIRKQKRKELGLENNLVIGHVGRFNLQKNHIFLINAFEQVVRREPKTRLVLIGGGPLEEKIKEIIKTKNLQEKVLFLGVRNDISDLYQVFDCFALPSLFEGLGIVAIEAQMAGLPCVLADTLPEEAFVCNYKKLPLDCADAWAKEIVSFMQDFKRTDTSKQIKAAGFCAEDIARKMQDFYLGLEQ